MKRFLNAVLPAFLLAISVGQIYAFTNFSDGIASHLSADGHAVTKAAVQFAFSLGIFFLGMGAAFFGKVVERNLRFSTILGTVLFLVGLAVTELGVNLKCLPLVYLGYGGLLGVGTGIIYIAPMKIMMLWFSKHKAIAAALPVVSFGLGSTLSTLLFKPFMSFGITRVFLVYAAFYAVPMFVAAFLLKKPSDAVTASGAVRPFSYGALFRDAFFLRSWLFMFLNICCGLSLIPLSRQMMQTSLVAYPEGAVTTVIALAGLMNGAGRLVFAWWSDRLARRINILLFILAISLAVVTLSFWPLAIGAAILVINACYGAGFSVMPAILADNYGMANITEIIGAVLSAWGVAGLVGNQTAILVSDRLGFGYYGVVTMLVVVYSLNLVNVLSLSRRSHGLCAGQKVVK